MQCRTCGTENPETELRCSKCQMRLHLAQARPRPESYPVIESAAAPQYEVQPDSPPSHGPMLAAMNEQPRTFSRRSYQAALFASGSGEKVVSFGDVVEPSGGGRTPAARATGSRRRRVHPDQGTFEFVPEAPVAQLLRREMDSSKAPIPVAPRSLRVASAFFDAMVVLAFSGVFLVTLQAMSRYLLEQSLFTRETLPYLLAAPLMFGFFYKLLFTTAGLATLGVQGLGLSLVSFDGARPTQAQRVIRMLAGWLSLVAGGMGLLWALGDQETLTWHDHISQTFLTASRPARG